MSFKIILICGFYLKTNSESLSLIEYFFVFLENYIKGAINSFRGVFEFISSRLQNERREWREL